MHLQWSEEVGEGGRRRGRKAEGGGSRFGWGVDSKEGEADRLRLQGVRARNKGSDLRDQFIILKWKIDLLIYLLLFKKSILKKIRIKYTDKLKMFKQSQYILFFNKNCN